NPRARPCVGASLGSYRCAPPADRTSPWRLVGPMGKVAAEEKLQTHRQNTKGRRWPFIRLEASRNRTQKAEARFPREQMRCLQQWGDGPPEPPMCQQLPKTAHWDGPVTF